MNEQHQDNVRTHTGSSKLIMCNKHKFISTSVCTEMEWFVSHRVAGFSYLLVLYAQIFAISLSSHNFWVLHVYLPYQQILNRQRYPDVSSFSFFFLETKKKKENCITSVKWKTSYRTKFSCRSHFRLHCFPHRGAILCVLSTHPDFGEETFEFHLYVDCFVSYMYAIVWFGYLSVSVRTKCEIPSIECTISSVQTQSMRDCDLNIQRNDYLLSVSVYECEIKYLCRMRKVSQWNKQ